MNNYQVNSRLINFLFLNKFKLVMIEKVSNTTWETTVGLWSAETTKETEVGALSAKHLNWVELDSCKPHNGGSKQHCPCRDILYIQLNLIKGLIRWLNFKGGKGTWSSVSVPVISGPSLKSWLNIGSTEASLAARHWYIWIQIRVVNKQMTKLKKEIYF